MQDFRSVHPFQRAPHATLVRLALPVLISLAAEPVTGAVDTAFVARLGAPSLAALLFQPINAFAFATDGIHWGTGDFRYLRNAMLGASAAGALGILLLDTTHPQALVGLWIITGGWVTLRALFGIVRIWPGIGRSPMTVEVRPREDR